MGEYEEVSTHLYDSVTTIPPNNRTATIEDVFLQRKKPIDLPKEKIVHYSPPNRPKTSMEGSSIFSGFKTSYDISHRRQRKPKERSIPPNLPDNLEPTVENVHPPKGKDFWVAKQRVTAKKLMDELDEKIKEYEETAKEASDQLEAKAIKLQNGIKIFHYILEKFTNEASEDSPERGEILTKITDYYKTLEGEIPEIQANFEKSHNAASESLRQAEENNKKLEAERDASVAVIDKQMKTIEGLKQQWNDCKLRCTSAENQLRDITNDKSAMSRSSHSNQEKLQDINAQIEEKKLQKKKLNDLIDTLTKDIARRTAELNGATNELKEVKEQLNKLIEQNKGFIEIIEDRNLLLTKLKNTPLRDSDRSNFHDVGVIVNTIPKKKEKQRTAEKTSSINGQDQFKQIKSDMKLVKKELLGADSEASEQPIKINTYEDLMKVRETILKNNNIFDFSVKSITTAHEGNFAIDKAGTDQARIFAHWMMERVMKRVCTSVMRSESEVQTDEVETMIQEKPKEEDQQQQEEEKELQELKLTPKLLVPFMKKSRFVTLLSSNESNREPKGLDWLVHSIRSIFDEKTIDDRTQVRKGDDVIPMPEYVIKWALRQFGREDLTQKGCWDIFITSHYHMQKYLEITLFVRFLDEYWTTEQLSFFLKCRMWILERCVSIPVQHIELNEYLTETFLTQSQVFAFFVNFFPDTEEELRNDISIRACDTADHERNTSKDASSIPMNRVLELAVGEQMDGRIRRIRRMLAFFRPVPRMTLRRFDNYIHQMIPNIDPNMVDSLYRSSLVPNNARSDIDQQDFIDLYFTMEPVLPKGYTKPSITCDEFAEYSPVYEIVLNRWKQMKFFLERMLQNLEEKKDSEIVRVLINEIRHETFQMLEAKSSFDGILFYQSYHRVLEVVLSACYKLNLPDDETFKKQVLDFQELLFDKHKQVVDQIEQSNSEKNII